MKVVLIPLCVLGVVQGNRVFVEGEMEKMSFSSRVSRKVYGCGLMVRIESTVTSQ